MKRLYLSAFLACGLMGTLTQVSSAGEIKIGPGDIKALLDLFKAADMPKPSITINETASSFDLSIIGGPVQSTLFSDTETFNTDFTAVLAGAEYWKGNISITTVNPMSIFSQDNDTITVSGNIFHQAVNGKPHPTDEAQGGIFTYSTLADSSVATKPGIYTGAPLINGVTDHPQTDGSAPHKDSYSGKITSTVTFQTEIGGHNNRISGYTFQLQGKHSSASSVPEPGAIALCGIGIAGLIGYAYRRSMPNKLSICAQG